MPTINWYPGHMAKSRRMLAEQLRAVDAVVELVDARAPLASANPDLRALTRGKARLLVLNKADLADDSATLALAGSLPREERHGHALQFQRRGASRKCSSASPAPTQPGLWNAPPRAAVKKNGAVDGGGHSQRWQEHVHQPPQTAHLWPKPRTAPASPAPSSG